MKKIFLVILSALFSMSYAISQSNVNQTGNKQNIVKSIENENSDTSKIIVNQDDRVDDLLNTYNSRVETTGPYSGSGYRVQVFSSNNYKTAKSDAARVERQIRNSFPAHQVYVVYASPFWKVRVGNFKTHEDAQKLRDDILKMYPALRKDCYIVRDANIKVN